jgi:hypothetical protein
LDAKLRVPSSDINADSWETVAWSSSSIASGQNSEFDLVFGLNRITHQIAFALLKNQNQSLRPIDGKDPAFADIIGFDQIIDPEIRVTKSIDRFPSGGH